MHTRWIVLCFIVLFHPLSHADVVVPSERVISGVSVRPEPSSQTQPMMMLRPGESLPFISRDNRYYYEVRLPNNESGWVSKSWTRVEAATPSTSSAASSLKISFFDVGQGDSTLIACPGGENILIDAGSTSGIEAEIIRDQLVDALVDRELKIDTLIITHPDADHYNKLQDVLHGISIDQLYRVGDINDYYTNFWTWMEILDSQIINLDQDDINQPNHPNNAIDCGAAEIYIFAANVQSSFSHKNTTSIVLMVRFNQFEAIFTGDATKKTEKAITDEYPAAWLDVDLLKIGHHGSLATSTTVNWADTLKPEIAVVSAGKNSYGHPRKEVIERLDDHTVTAPAHPMSSATRVNEQYIYTFVPDYDEAIYSTQVSGLVQVTSDGTSWNVTTQHIEH